MSLNAEALLASRIAPFEERVTERDMMLFALSIGVGRDPSVEEELQYVFEEGCGPFRR